MITGKAKVAGVIGDPVSHSLSPVLHGYWLQRYGIDGAYVPFAVKQENFEQVFSLLPSMGISGVNLTLPYKEIALGLCDEVEEVARKIGAVNTVIFSENGIIGTNTDAAGFALSMDAEAPGWDRAKSAFVLGAGGAARAIVYALKQRGVADIFIANRTKENAEELAQVFGTRIVDWEKREQAAEGCELLIQTTSLGMRGAPELSMQLSALPENAIVADIVYTPQETALMERAKRRGLKAVGGLGMLVYQAREGFSRWYGREPEVEAKLWQVLRDRLAAGS